MAAGKAITFAGKDRISGNQVLIEGQAWETPPLGIWPGPGDPDFPGGGKPPGGGGEPPVGIWPGPGDPDFPGGGRPPVDPPVDPPYPGHPEWVWAWVIPIQKWMPVYVPGEGEAGPKA